MSETQQRDQDVPGDVVFRSSPLGVLAALMLAVCMAPVALTVPGLVLLYLVPLGIIGWIVRIRTTVNTEALSVRGAMRTTRVPWAEVCALRLHNRSRLSAVLSGGTELGLPAVHVRDLPLLALASGGRLPDPDLSTGRRTSPASGKE